MPPGGIIRLNTRKTVSAAGARWKIEWIRGDMLCNVREIEKYEVKML